jgi:DNA-binding PadR family transcriptional regulator
MFGHIFFSRHRCDEMRAMGRHGRHGGYGHFARGFSGDGDGEGFRWGRKLASTDLQLVLLALLAEGPSHGYELIKALEEKSGGFYSPSPGMIYPALTYLEEIGHATVVAEGTKKRYEITPEGRAHLAEHADAAQTILEQIERIGAKMQKVRRFFTGEGEDEGGRGEHAGLHRARSALKSALHSARAGTPEEEERIAKILQRAADEIAGRKP